MDDNLKDYLLCHTDASLIKVVKTTQQAELSKKQVKVGRPSVNTVQESEYSC